MRRYLAKPLFFIAYVICVIGLKLVEVAGFVNGGSEHKPGVNYDGEVK